jgi:hypothetical protein
MNDVNEEIPPGPVDVRLYLKKLYPKFKTFFKHRVPVKYNYKLIFEHFFLFLKYKNFYSAVHSFLALADKKPYAYYPNYVHQLKKRFIKKKIVSSPLYVVGYERSGFDISKIISDTPKLVRHDSRPAPVIHVAGFWEIPYEDIHYKQAQYPELTKPILISRHDLSDPDFLRANSPEECINELFVDDHLALNNKSHRMCDSNGYRITLLREDDFKYNNNDSIDKEANKKERVKFYKNLLYFLPLDADYDPYRVWLNDQLNNKYSMYDFKWLHKINDKRMNQNSKSPIVSVSKPTITRVPYPVSKRRIGKAKDAISSMVPKIVPLPGK